MPIFSHSAANSAVNVSTPSLITLQALAAMMGQPPISVLRDLEKRKYLLFSVHTASGQVDCALTREDVDRYFAQRRAEGFRPPRLVLQRQV